MIVHVPRYSKPKKRKRGSLLDCCNRARADLLRGSLRRGCVRILTLTASRCMPSPFAALSISVLVAIQSPLDLLRVRRETQMKAFASMLGDNFGGAAELGVHSAAGFVHGRRAVAHRYDVHVLVVDTRGEHAGVLAAILREVARDTASARLWVQTASLAPMPPTDAAPFLENVRAAHTRLGIATDGIKVPAALRPHDLCVDGGFDMLLTTDLEVQACVREMRPRTVRAFCAADFMLHAEGLDAPDAAAMVRAVAGLPKPLRGLLASSAQSPLNIYPELPVGASPNGEEWDRLLAAAVACSLGFSVRLRRLTRTHACHTFLHELMSQHPIAESLGALEPSDATIAETFRSDDAARRVLSTADMRKTIQS